MYALKPNDIIKFHPTLSGSLLKPPSTSHFLDHTYNPAVTKCNLVVKVAEFTWIGSVYQYGPVVIFTAVVAIFDLLSTLNIKFIMDLHTTKIDLTRLSSNSEWVLWEDYKNNFNMRSCKTYQAVMSIFDFKPTTKNTYKVHFVVDHQRKTFQPCLVSNVSILSDKKILITFFTFLNFV